uniref:Membrane protein n=1 Tax=uncultured bacterium AR_456 TaxID=1630014 RepID=A0A0E3JRM9_9BACT|nr:membrane protein [uncultured bacterium AR_456]
MANTRTRSRRSGIGLPGTVLGIGLGGFVDGILLHQLLQWHHMLSSTDTDNIGVPTYPPDTLAGLRMNTVWDGVFHTLTWLAVLVGLGMLYARVSSTRGPVWRSRELWGWILVGWGIFNLVEGVLDHHVLGIHHVHGGPYQLWWDLGFLALGAVLVATGWLVRRPAAERVR